jgi:hypothetical protein
MKLWRLSRRPTGLILAKDLYGNTLQVPPRELELVVLGGDVAVFPRTPSKTLAIAWQGPDGLWYCDAVWASSLQYLLQVVLH